MKKKNVLALMAAVIMTASILTGCGKEYTVQLTDTNPVKVELGSELSTDVRDYITVCKGEEAVNEGEVFEEISLDLSNIDTNTVGTYTLIISYKKNQLVIPIIVEDTTAPVIKVEDMALEAGTEVTADAITVTDLQEVEVTFILPDGTRADRFTFEGEPMEVTVEAADAAGNKAEETFTVTILDTVAPVINVEDVTITVGTDFDPMKNVTAIDDVDGEVAVTVEGTVDVDKEGTYTLTYKASDAAGNKATAERTVTVKKQASTKGNSSKGSSSTGNTSTGNASTGSTGNTSAGNTSTGNAAQPSTPAPSNPSTPPATLPSDGVTQDEVDQGLKDVDMSTPRDEMDQI